MESPELNTSSIRGKCSVESMAVALHWGHHFSPPPRISVNICRYCTLSHGALGRVSGGVGGGEDVLTALSECRPGMLGIHKTQEAPPFQKKKRIIWSKITLVCYLSWNYYLPWSGHSIPLKVTYDGWHRSFWLILNVSQLKTPCLFHINCSQDRLALVPLRLWTNENSFILIPVKFHPVSFSSWFWPGGHWEPWSWHSTKELFLPAPHFLQQELQKRGLKQVWRWLGVSEGGLIFASLRYPSQLFPACFTPEAQGLGLNTPGEIRPLGERTPPTSFLCTSLPGNTRLLPCRVGKKRQQKGLRHEHGLWRGWGGLFPNFFWHNANIWTEWNCIKSVILLFLSAELCDSELSTKSKKKNQVRRPTLKLYAMMHCQI